MARKGTPGGRPSRQRRAEAPGAAPLPRLAAVRPGSLGFTGLCAVAMSVPLVVLGNATGPYEDSKAWALWVLVGAAGVGWLLARGLGRRPVGDPTDADGPLRLLRWAVLAYGGWWAVTTLSSIAPGQSLWGSFARGHGLLTLVAALVLFGLVQSECRGLGSARFLVDAALLGSVPVCLLAFGQALGWDPLPKPWDPAIASLRVRSTFGQHIFLGSYLVLLIPLTAARLAWALQDARALDGGSAARHHRSLLLGSAWAAGAVGIVALASRWPSAWWALVPWGVSGAVWWAGEREREPDRGAVKSSGRLAVALLAVLFAAQVLVVLLSRARGPFLGMLAGLAVTALALFALRRAWKPLVAATAALAAIVVFLVMLNVPGSPVASLRGLPLLTRLGRMMEVEPPSPAWVRIQIWRGMLSAWTRQVRGEEVIPEVSPRARSLVGYGLETQLSTLDTFARPFLGQRRARGDRPVRYGVDRAHNEILDHVATGGLVAAGLWLSVTGGVAAVGVRRIRTSPTEPERMLRLGCLGAVVAHVVEAQVGVTTPMPRALFWMAAALLTLPAGMATGDARARSGSTRELRVRWLVATLAAGLLAAGLAWGGTRWLLASAAYAEGTQRGLAGDLEGARAEFARAGRLAPSLSLPWEAVADTSLRLAAAARDPRRRIALLREAESALAQAHRHTAHAAAPWGLTGRVAFALHRAGEPGKLAAAREAFRAAARQRPMDPEALAQWALACLEDGDPAQARLVAEQAVTLWHRAWLGWAVLARAARALGDLPEAERAADKARDVAPPEARRILDDMLR